MFTYGLPLNPITSIWSGRIVFAAIHLTSEDKHIVASGLIEKSNLAPEYKTREEKLARHGFIDWRRQKTQNVVGAVKCRLPSGALLYHIRESDWIATKHLQPVNGRWVRAGNEIRFWDVQEKKADTLIKRMINCLDCGFCMVECFPCRQFDRTTKQLRIQVALSAASVFG